MNPTAAQLATFAQSIGQPNLPMDQLLAMYKTVFSLAPASPAPAPAANPADPFAQYGLTAPAANPVVPAPPVLATLPATGQYAPKPAPAPGVTYQASQTVSPAPTLSESESLNLQLKQLRDQLAYDQQQRQATDAANRRANTILAAKNWIDSKILTGQITSAERYNLANQYQVASEDDFNVPRTVLYLDPTNGSPTQGTRLEALVATVERRPRTNTGNRVVVADPYQQALAGSLYQNAPANPENAVLAEIDAQVAAFAKHTNGRPVPAAE